MSSIIDALKKSDKNRTAESGHNINQIKFGNEPPQKSRRGFWLLVLVLLLIAFSVFAWQQGWHHAVVHKAKALFGSNQSSQLEPSNQVPNTTADQPTSAEAAEESINEVVINENKPKTSSQTKNEQTNKLTRPKSSDVKAKTLAAEQAKQRAESTPSTDHQDQLQVIAQRDSQNKQSIADDSNQQTTDTSDISQVTPGDETGAPTESEPANINEQQQAKQERKDLEPSLKQDYLLIHQIDFEIRKNIPPVKLNVHIYDPEPENRMVILNGVKYTIGDNIEEIIMIEEINQEGVVLAFEGTRFLIPK